MEFVLWSLSIACQKEVWADLKFVYSPGSKYTLYTSKLLLSNSSMIFDSLFRLRGRVVLVDPLLIGVCFIIIFLSSKIGFVYLLRLLYGLRTLFLSICPDTFGYVFSHTQTRLHNSERNQQSDLGNPSYKGVLRRYCVIVSFASRLSVNFFIHQQS